MVLSVVIGRTEGSEKMSGLEKGEGEASTFVFSTRYPCYDRYDTPIHACFYTTITRIQ